MTSMPKLSINRLPPARLAHAIRHSLLGASLLGTAVTNAQVLADFPQVIELSALNQAGGVSGVNLTGVDAYDNAGNSVSNAGDFNGDGINDVIVSAYSSDPNGNMNAGETYIVFGSSSHPGSISLNTIGASDIGATINGIDSGDLSGASVSNAGDINGDGIDDVLIGAVVADPGDRESAGESYVVFGSTSVPAVINLSDLNQPGGHHGLIINGINRYDGSGVSVSNAGDINGDGMQDLIIGASNASPGGALEAGQAYLVFGASNLSTTIELSALNQPGEARGAIINGLNDGDRLGISVNNAGDINGDGIDDLLLGAYRASPDSINDAGQTYLLFGSTDFPETIDLSRLNLPGSTTGVIINGVAEGDLSGRSISNAGDFNNDGMDDLLIGAWFADPNSSFEAGQSYVVFGNTQLPPVIELSAINQPGSVTGVVINGADSGHRSGTSVSNAGDINGDGIDDIIIGAYQADLYGQIRQGFSYVVFGASNLPSTIELSALNQASNVRGVQINGINAGDDAGRAVSAAGDFNADGIDDVLIGARSADFNSAGIPTGEAYVVFGIEPGLIFRSGFELFPLNRKEPIITTTHSKDQ